MNTPARSIIRTVCGDILAADAGFAHCHEHAFILPGPSARLNPQLLLDDLDKTVAELSEFRAAGGATIVDAQPIGPERAPGWQKAASERSGANIIACTGFHRNCYYGSEHFRFHESAEALAARLVEEINGGMAVYAGPAVIERTEVRAGMIKFASDYHLIDAAAQRAAEAAAIAHHETGAPILTHTEHGTCGLQQVKLFERLGVAASALLVSHLDRNPDRFVHEDVAASGAYLVYDGVSRVKYHPDSTLVRLISDMLQAGHGSRILLGMDMGPRSMWRSYGGGPGMAYLANVFLPKLRRSGLTTELIDMFTIRNPAAALAMRQVDEP